VHWHPAGNFRACSGSVCVAEAVVEEVVQQPLLSAAVGNVGNHKPVKKRSFSVVFLLKPSFAAGQWMTREDFTCLKNY